MPVLFVGHGSPMIAVQDDKYSRALKIWGEDLRKKFSPRAILVVSAHWQTEGTKVTSLPEPRQIYDFGGFPAELYLVKYPVKGSPDLAKRVCALLPGSSEDIDWGVDHGSWTVLMYLFPKADVPVVQLSLDKNLTTEGHLALAAKLSPLRDEGVLIVGSGDIVHSFVGIMGPEDAPVEIFASEFEQTVRTAIEKNDLKTLCSYKSLGKFARQAVPTPEHFLPLLYVLGLREKGDATTIHSEGFQFGAISMTSYQIAPLRIPSKINS